ncbi:hypothetical protein [Legionella tunisiensis]|uniref:hypothetical protein n=1 Tax=Legionella tunisiensis TaxID=1034944 RepID=UPI0002D825CA|nr:hypothetical protein [Legionella tunisiensis]
MGLERNIQLHFKNKTLTSVQAKFVANYIREIHTSLNTDRQTLKQAIGERKHFLNYPLPMPMLEEQIETHEIFPDNPVYYKVSF